jgi:PKD repeat protein
VSGSRQRINLRPAVAAGAVGVAALAFAGPASAAGDPPSRLEGNFTMSGKVLRTKNIQGEKKGQKYTRTWKFTPSCATGPCQKVQLIRTLSNGSKDTVNLTWNGSAYISKRNLTVAGNCNGKPVKKTDHALVKISATVTGTADRKGVPVSTKLDATFSGDHKIACPGGAKATASTASSLTGVRTDPPKPPVADFEFDPPSGSVADGSNQISFFDASSDPDGGKLASWQWSFGDGGTDAAQNPTHTFASPGTYSVTLTVVDADDGASSTISHDMQIAP